MKIDLIEEAIKVLCGAPLSALLAASAAAEDIAPEVSVALRAIATERKCAAQQAICRVDTERLQLVFPGHRDGLVPGRDTDRIRDLAWRATEPGLPGFWSSREITDAIVCGDPIVAAARATLATLD